MADFVPRIINDSELSQWDELVKKSGSIFQSSIWLNLYNNRNQKVQRVGIFKKDNILVGGFVLEIRKKYGLTVVHNPAFLPYCGPFYSFPSKGADLNSQLRNISYAFLDYLESLHPHIVSLYLAPKWVDGIPFYWRKYKVIYAYTYQIDLYKNEEELFAFLNSERRRRIKQAAKIGITIKNIVAIKDVIHIVELTYQRKKKALPVEMMRQIVSELNFGENSYAVGAYENGILTALVYIVHDNKYAYLLISGSLYEAHPSAKSLALYQAILQAKAMGLSVFDFEGSVLPGVESFDRSFGGTITRIMTLNKAILPLEIALKFYRRSRF